MLVVFVEIFSLVIWYIISEVSCEIVQNSTIESLIALVYNVQKFSHAIYTNWLIQNYLLVLSVLCH